MDLKKFREENGITEWTVGANHCKCHPDTCCCDDWAVFANGGRFCTIFSKMVAQTIAASLQTADDLAQLTYDYATGKTNGEELVEYVNMGLKR